MAGKNEDGGTGAATINLSEVESGKKAADLAGNLDGLDFGDELEEEEEVEEKEPEPKKAEKKAPKKAAEKKAAPVEEEEEEEEIPDEEEEEEEEAEEKEPEAKKQVKMVPQARLMHVKTQRDRLEQQLREKDAQLQQLAQQSGNAQKAEEYETRIEQMYINLEKARAAGNVEESAKLARELDKVKEEASKRQAAAISHIEARNLLERRLYDTVVTQLELAAPATNPESEEFDQELVNDLDAATRGYESQGLSPSEALKKAAKRLIGKDVFTEKSIRREKQPEPKKTDVARNMAAVKKMPPTAVKEERTEKTQVLKATHMSREEFNALPEAAQRRLLGDEIE